MVVGKYDGIVLEAGFTSGSTSDDRGNDFLDGLLWVTFGGADKPALPFGRFTGVGGSEAVIP